MSKSLSHDEHERLHPSNPDAANAALRSLKAGGLRITAARRAVLEALARQPVHLTADELSEIMGGRTAHLATVYRTLELLVEAGVVTTAPGPGNAVKYHLAATPEGQEHLHGHCRKCKAVVVLSADTLDEAVVKLTLTEAFYLEPEHSILSGLCGNCKRVSPSDQDPL